MFALALVTAASAQAPAARPFVTAAEYSGWAKTLSNWGRWGKDDQAGALNLITPARRREAAALVRDGVTVSLAVDVNEVRGADNPTPYERVVTTAGPPYAMDRLAVTYHGGAHTHMDALSHRIFDGKIYNGFEASPNSTYLRDDRADLMAKTALLINCEHVAAAQTLNWSTTLREATGVDPRRWWVNGSRALFDVTLAAYRTFGVNIVGDMDPSASGEMGTIARLAPSIQLIHSPEIKHTDHDIPAIVPSVGLEAVGRAYARIIDGVNKETLAALKPAAR